MPKAVALYARVSTRDQSTAAQLDDLRSWAAREGLDAREFIDEGESGAKASRPALERLLAAVRRREVGIVACTKLDRLARSLRQLVDVAAELDARGVDLVVLDQRLDTGTPGGRLTFHVLGAVAEFERDLIAERTRAGIAAARRRGKRIGRPRSHVPEGRARELHAAGVSVSKIARDLGCSRTAVRRRLGLLS